MSNGFEYPPGVVTPEKKLKVLCRMERLLFKQAQAKLELFHPDKTKLVPREVYQYVAWHWQKRLAIANEQLSICEQFANDSSQDEVIVPLLTKDE